MTKGHYIRRDDGKWLCGNRIEDKPDYPYPSLSAAMENISRFRITMAVFCPARQSDQFSVFHFDPEEVTR